MALIYIVEDDDSIREIESFALINSGHEICGFRNAKEFYEKLKIATPDLCLLDLMLPDESGNEITRKLRANQETREIPIIMVTAKTTDLDLVKGIEDGADDYIKKPFSVMELISRVKALLRRTKSEEIKELTFEEITINNDKREVRVNGEIIDLTYKEYELLTFFILNKGIVLKRELIMNKVWGLDYEGETRTIDMHVKTLRKKLGSSGARIKTIRNVGYVLNEE